MTIARSAEAGPVFSEGSATMVVPAILAGASADVALPANAQFESAAPGAPVDVCLIGAPLAGLAGLIAWVSNPATGVITVRFLADAAGCAGGNQLVFFRKAR